MGRPGLPANYDRIRQVMELRASGLKYREIGERMGVSIQRAHQLHWKGIKIWREKALGITQNPDPRKEPRPGTPRLTICVGCGKEMEIFYKSINPGKIEETCPDESTPSLPPPPS